MDARRAEEERREFVERMSEAERLAGFGAWRWELETGRVRWSDQLHRIYGLEPGEFAGTVDAFVSYLHPGDRERVWTLVERAIRDASQFLYEERILRADGAERILLSQGRAISAPDGRVTTLVGICQDVTERVEAQRALGHSERRMRAIIDNTPSIVAVKDLSGRYLMANAETGRVLGVHPDELVGHECAELFPTISAQLRADDLRAAADMDPVLDQAILKVDGESRTYLTVTFALPDENGRPVETCTVATDVTERHEREAERRERRRWESQIDAAVRDDRLVAFAQPVVAVDGGESDWCELLVRMRPPGEPDALLLPGAFLPAAEQYRLVQKIDVFMVEEAIRIAGGVSPEVNISAVTLSDPVARHEIVERLTAAPEAARRITFEITETAAADHLDAACEFAEELASLGCGLALDDFGTGFGSFTYLRRIPLRYLKIDASFVMNLADSVDDQRVVRSIVGIATQFGLRTIAEGVEDEETLRILRDLGADFAQGFHLGIPAPITLPHPRRSPKLTAGHRRRRLRTA